MMLRKVLLLLFALILIPCISFAETIDVQIKGVDDGVKTTNQQDYKEAVLFAKREAIERAGVKVKALTTARDFVVESDYIESKAEAVLLPGYNIIDVGYQSDGTYLVILIGKVMTSISDSDTKEVFRDDRFIKYANGVVWDTDSGLEWYAGPDRNINWYEAKKWVENLNVAGGGWRMPTIRELGTPLKKIGLLLSVTPLLYSLTGTGDIVWSDKCDEDSFNCWGVPIDSNKGYDYGSGDHSRGFRAFAVRNHK